MGTALGIILILALCFAILFSDVFLKRSMKKKYDNANVEVKSGVIKAKEVASSIEGYGDYENYAYITVESEEIGKRDYIISAFLYNELLVGFNYQFEIKLNKVISAKEIMPARN